MAHAGEQQTGGSGALDEAGLRAALASTAARAGWDGGAPIELHASLGSTNDRALELAEGGAPEGTLVIAQEQTSGRGRRGHTWSSPEGGLYLSLVLRPEEAMLRRLPATLLGGLAVCQALEDAGVKPQLKWPNDVLHDGLKLAGILGEMSRGAEGHRLVLGVGINVSTQVFPPELEGIATSVSTLAGAAGVPAPGAGAIAASFLTYFAEHYGAVRRGGGATILAMASARMPLLGRPIRVRLGPDRVLSGIASGLSATGGLVLEHEDGQRREVLLAGEVEGVA